MSDTGYVITLKYPVRLKHLALVANTVMVTVFYLVATKYKHCGINLYFCFAFYVYFKKHV